MGFVFCLSALLPLHAVAQNLSANTAAAPAPSADALPPLRVKLSAVRHAMLAAPMSGHIVHLSVRDGERFKQGQMLLQLNCAVPISQLQRAEGASQKSRAVYESTRKLAELQSRSQVELSVARAEAEQAAADLAIARTMVSRCSLIAPFAGIVTEAHVKAHQFINEGQPSLEIADPSKLELEFIMPSQWLAWFSPGARFLVKVSETQSTHEAQLTRLGGKVDAVSQSIKAYAHFVHQDARLLPGMSGEALITPKPNKETPKTNGKPSK